MRPKSAVPLDALQLPAETPLRAICQLPDGPVRPQMRTRFQLPNGSRVLLVMTAPVMSARTARNPLEFTYTRPMLVPLADRSRSKESVGLVRVATRTLACAHTAGAVAAS